MAVPSLVEALGTLESTPDISIRIQLLSRLKSEAIGHLEKKELLVNHGLIDILAQLLQIQAKARGKQPSQSNGVQNGHAKPSALWSPEDELTLHCIHLLATLAHEGPAFVTPILASNVVACLVSLLPTVESHRLKITIATLKALYALATASKSTNPTAESFATSSSSEHLYSKAAVQDLAFILADKSHAPIVQTKLSLVCQLISLTCVTDQRRTALLEGGVLDLLAARLAAYRVHEASSPLKFVKCPANSLLAPNHFTLGHVIGALVSIIHTSEYRAVRLLFSAAVTGCFPFLKPNSQYDHSINAQNYLALESLLPRVHYQKSENGFSKPFPLANLDATANGSRGLSEALASSDSRQMNAWKAANESSIIPWLFNIVKTHNGLTRIQAANLLATFDKLELLNQMRERLLALVVIPMLINSEATVESFDIDGNPNESSTDRQHARELSRFILAKILPRSQSLQSAAADAACKEQICKTMKETFEPVKILPSTWSPSVTNSANAPEFMSPTRKLGLPGLRPELASLYREREGALLLLAAMANTQDTYRTDFTKNGMTQCIIDSMKPFDQDALKAAEKSSQASRRKMSTLEFGNPDPVLIAACDAARSLSRSVAVIRTSLIDGGIVKPTLALLKHPNVEVLKAATDVICNIVLEFSPMRQELVEAGATTILCEHAHSADSETRLRSLWALKHLVCQAPHDIKTSCLEELGTGWLVQIVTGGIGSNSNDRQLQPLASASMTAANAAGEQVEILNTSEDTLSSPQGWAGGDISSTIPLADGEDIAMRLISTGSEPSLAPALTPEERAIRNRAFEDAQLKSSWSTKLTEEKIQVQGLDFIRNSILVPGDVEMVDYYFQTLGAGSVFDIIAHKLKVTANPAIKLSAIMILVHIAASAHRHRQQIISQPTLLQALLPLMGHPSPDIRCASCWVAHNLTWTDNTDDDGDIPPARLRAFELRKLGFEDALKAMRNDVNVDVSERARAVTEQISHLLDGSGGDSSRTAR